MSRLLVNTFLYVSLRGLALIRWGRPAPWSRIDLFSVTAILLLVGMTSLHSRIIRALGDDAGRKFVGADFDPSYIRTQRLRRLVEVLAFADYGNGLLLPSLAVSSLQIAGVVVAPLVVIWLWWVDSYFIAHFPAALSGAMMEGGPFRRIRHPRYLGLLAGRLAFAALLGSVFSWMLFVLNARLFWRRIVLEERHLRTQYPEEYDRLIKRTGRLLPRITRR